MPKYPYTKVMHFNDCRENGLPVYAVWRFLAADNASIKGTITKTLRGTWQVDLDTRHYGQRIAETAKFSVAKVMARELLA
jgi:hypothetical protein